MKRISISQSVNIYNLNRCYVKFKLLYGMNLLLLYYSYVNYTKILRLKSNSIPHTVTFKIICVHREINSDTSA